MRDFNHSVNVLVKAYMNNTLAHKMCTACAVGNLVADAKGGLKPQITDNEMSGFDCWRWSDGTMAEWYKNVESFRYGYPCRTNDQVTVTGYTIEEISEIEKAFEGVEYPEDQSGEWCRDDDYMLRGLMAVVDVLADIHGIDLTVREETKKLFVKP